MKKTMKKLIFVLLFCVLSSFCFSQSFDFIEEVVNSKEVSFLQVVTLVSQDLSFGADSSENADISQSLVSAYPNLKKIVDKYEVNPNQAIELADFSQIICTCYDVKSSLMYIIFGTPRYAFRQLVASGYFSATAQPNAKLTGVKALSIIADFGETLEK